MGRLASSRAKLAREQGRGAGRAVLPLKAGTAEMLGASVLMEETRRRVLSFRQGRSEGLRRAPDGSAPAGCDFLPQQDIRRIAQLMAVLQEHPRQLAGLPRPMTQVRGKHRAVIEVRAKAVGQISATARTPGQVRTELGPSIAACARDAVGDRVIPAVRVEKRRLLEAQRAGPVAIEMEQANALRDDRVIRRDDLKAPGTRRVRLLDHEPHS